MSRQSTNKFGRIYEHTESDFSQIPKQLDMINLFWKDLEYVNEEGKPAKPSDPNPNDMFAKSKYEYNSIKNRLARKKVREIYKEREEWHRKAEEKKYKPIERYSSKHYTFNPDDMHNMGLYNNSKPTNGLTDYNDKTYGDTGGDFRERIGSRTNDLVYNIRNRRPNFSDLTTNAIRKMYEHDAKFGKGSEYVYRGPMYNDALRMAQNIVRIRPKYDHKDYEHTIDPQGRYYEGDYYR